MRSRKLPGNIRYHAIANTVSGLSIHAKTPRWIVATEQLPEVLRKSGQQFHPIIESTGNLNDKVEGMLFEISETEILNADEYEVDDYKRIEVEFQSGKKGFIYIKK